MAVRAYIDSMQKTIAKINLSAIISNAEHLKSLCPGKKFYGVVKADAYGHGAIEVSRALQSVCDGLCVAIVDEGVELRAAGISLPILVFTPPLGKDDALRMRAYDLTATAADVRSAGLCRGLRVHVKVNTGMNRYGCVPGDIKEVLFSLKDSIVEGVYSHIYAPLSPQHCKEQLSAFKAAADIVRGEYPQATAHFAATAGTLMGGEYLFDGVRCGIGLYGYAPDGFRDEKLIPALRVYARRVQSFVPPFGGGVGYAEAQKKYARLSSYRAGYADGLARTCALGEGNLCMDSFVSQRWEEELCIFSDANEYAAKLGTISYEALCAVTKRSLRVYER